MKKRSRLLKNKLEEAGSRHSFTILQSNEIIGEDEVEGIQINNGKRFHVIEFFIQLESFRIIDIVENTSIAINRGIIVNDENGNKY